MKNIILTIIMFAIALALIISVILPIADHGRTAGDDADGQVDTIETSIGTLETEID